MNGTSFMSDAQKAAQAKRVQDRGNLWSQAVKELPQRQQQTAEQAGYKDWNSYQQSRLSGDVTADAMKAQERVRAQAQQLGSELYNPQRIDPQGQGISAQTALQYGQRLGRGTGAGYQGLNQAANMMMPYATGQKSVAMEQARLQQQQAQRDMLSQMYSSGAASPAALLNAQNAASRASAQIGGQATVAAAQERQQAIQQMANIRSAQGQLGQAQAAGEMRALGMGMEQQANAARFQQAQEQAALARDMGIRQFVSQDDLNRMQLLYGAQSAEAQAQNQKLGGILGAASTGFGALTSGLGKLFGGF